MNNKFWLALAVGGTLVLGAPSVTVAQTNPGVAQALDLQSEFLAGRFLTATSEETLLAMVTEANETVAPEVIATALGKALRRADDPMKIRWLNNVARAFAQMHPDNAAIPQIIASESKKKNDKTSKRPPVKNPNRPTTNPNPSANPNNNGSSGQGIGDLDLGNRDGSGDGGGIGLSQ